MIYNILKKISTLITFASAYAASYPVVLLHGVASDSTKMNTLSNWIQDTFQTKVFNIEIGNGVKTSMYTALPIQLEELCQTIYKNDELKEGFNFIGMSQGGLLARGYVERCNAYPVKNLITLVSPNGGTIVKSIDLNMYTDFYQNHFSVSNYWRDPLKLNEYLTMCCYLPILNNEIIIDIIKDNDVYGNVNSYIDDDDDDDDDYVDNNDIANNQREQLKTLENFVMVWSPNDGIVFPPESGKFSFYDEFYNVIPLENTELYKTDALGLKYLNENNKLHIHHTNCTHTEHRDPICFDQLYPIFVLYL
jgi:palmitoyl-protein thioesterase